MRPILFLFALAESVGTAMASFFHTALQNTMEDVSPQPLTKELLPISNNHIAQALFSTALVSGTVSVDSTCQLTVSLSNLPPNTNVNIAVTHTTDFGSLFQSSCKADSSALYNLAKFVSDGNGAVNSFQDLGKFDSSPVEKLLGNGIVLFQANSGSLDYVECPNGIPLAGAAIALVQLESTPVEQGGEAATLSDFLNNNQPAIKKSQSVIPPTDSRTASRNNTVNTAAITYGLAPLNSFSKKITYVDQVSKFPTAAQLAVPGFAVQNDYNIVNMAFWLDKGPADAALSWTRLEPKVRQSYLDAFHSSGKRVLVSAFGETDHPTMNDVDPVECAQRLAEFVIEYGFDGADIDYEDNHAMHLGKAEDWVISFMKTLRPLLPSPQFIISHAPQPPMFSKNKEFYPKGGYTTIHKDVGHLIDFYNVQFYNQGATTKYETCQTLLVDSGTHTPGTALFQIAEMGVPLDKLVVGKPTHPNGTTSSGYMDSRYLASCIEQAKKYGWAAGIMGWNFELDPQGEWIKVAASSLRNSRLVPIKNTTTVTQASTARVEPTAKVSEGSGNGNGNVETYLDPLYGLLILSHGHTHTSLFQPIVLFLSFLFAFY